MEKTSKSPILYSSKEECCGCALCCAVCPSQAINMEYDTLLIQTKKEIKMYKMQKMFEDMFFPKKDTIQG